MSTHIITGGLGFLGSHLSVRLAQRGENVVILDLPGADDRLLRLISGIGLADPSPMRSGTTLKLTSRPVVLNQSGPAQFARPQAGTITVMRGDATDPNAIITAQAAAAAAAGLPGLAEAPTCWAFACHAAPDVYKLLPVETLEACALGNREAVAFAKLTGGKVVLASTSEVYGDPLVHPQTESYRGNVDPVGPRSCYDEGKRFAEAYLTAALPASQRAIVRISNTIGPCSIRDTRMVPSFVRTALREGVIHVRGDGQQTRSPIYVTDLLDGIEAVVAHGDGSPYNVGGDEELSVGLVASTVASVLRFTYGREVEIRFGDARCAHDPQRRLPDLSRVRKLGWKGPRWLAPSAVDQAAAWLVDSARHWREVFPDPQNLGSLTGR